MISNQIPLSCRVVHFFPRSVYVRAFFVAPVNILGGPVTTRELVVKIYFRTGTKAVGHSLRSNRRSTIRVSL